MEAQTETPKSEARRNFELACLLQSQAEGNVIEVARALLDARLVRPEDPELVEALKVDLEARIAFRDQASEEVLVRARELRLAWAEKRAEPVNTSRINLDALKVLVK